MGLPTESARTTAARAEKSVKPLFGWLIYRRLSLPLSVRLARTRVMPWQITATGLALGLAAGGALGVGTYRWALAGALLANLGMLADAMDGEVARAKQVASRAGYVLDVLCDRLRDTAIIAGCGIGAHRAGVGGAFEWTIAAIAAYLFFFYLSSVSPAHWREAQGTADLSVKHMIAWTRVRVGIGDSVAVLVAVVAFAGRPILLVQAVALLTPLVMAMKVRHLVRLRPWDPSPLRAPEAHIVVDLRTDEETANPDPMTRTP